MNFELYASSSHYTQVWRRTKEKTEETKVEHSPLPQEL